LIGEKVLKWKWKKETRKEVLVIFCKAPC